LVCLEPSMNQLLLGDFFILLFKYSSYHGAFVLIFVYGTIKHF